MGLIVVTLLAVGGAALFLWWLSREEVQKKRKEAARRAESQRWQAAASSGNNHDHLKHKHTTREKAEQEIRRMKSIGKDGCERLNAYYNDELDGWFVGRGQW
jgi:hypothetical protein